MASDQDWLDARRLARYVRARGRCGLRRDDAESMMRAGMGDFGRVFGLAYSRGWIDVCGRYLVVPAGQVAGFRDSPAYPGTIPAHTPPPIANTLPGD